VIGARFGMEAPMTMYGLKVYVQPDQPKMQLGEPVKQYLTPAQIADHNAWLLRFFGTTNMVPDGQYLLSEQFGFVSMNPRTYEQFRRAAFHG
jgi:hypothetical protein